MRYTIIGAGIGGLSTALAFEKKGLDYELYEKAPRLDEVGAGIWLAPNALQVLDALGILDQIKLAGNSIDRITLGKFDLSPLSDNPQDKVKDRFGYTTVAIHRAELQRILFEKIPPHKVHLGKAFRSFEQLENNKIRIIFDDNSETETDFLIGADGIHSKVRQQVFPDSKIRMSGQTCWRGVADYTLNDEFKHRGLELWGDQVRFGISKISENKVYWFAVALSEQNNKDDKNLIVEKLTKMFSVFHPLVNDLILSTRVNKILRNDINDLTILKNWYKDSVCLIGDAAHATTPNMGQGGAQAIEDAYYLSKLIAENNKENTFQLFQKKRKKKVDTIISQSWTTGKMAHWKYGQGFRNFLLKSMPSSLIEKKMMEMYEVEK